MRYTRLFFFTVAMLTPLIIHVRSRWQVQEPSPTLTICWQDKPEKIYRLQHNRLEKWAIFDRIQNANVKNYQLPTDFISLDPHAEKIATQTIHALCEDFLLELMRNKHHKKPFSTVDILKDTDFNYQHTYGTIIVKFKTLPLVLKLFCETPNSFVRPFSKGTVPSFLFSMGGGINRFLAGFTRIPNLEAIRLFLEQNQTWKKRISLPRKWYWIPKHTQYLSITGNHFSQNPDQSYHLTLPATYGIIADFIPVARPFSIKNAADRNLAIELQHLFENRIDPYLCNFFYTKSGTIALIDTEHFASILGLDNNDQFSNYTNLVLGIAKRCIRRNFLTTKSERKKRCWRETPACLTL